jgi:hypothetical protein
VLFELYLGLQVWFSSNLNVYEDHNTTYDRVTLAQVAGRDVKDKVAQLEVYRDVEA